jgi:hypothetical protein
MEKRQKDFKYHFMKYLILLLFCLPVAQVSAQTTFISSGRIEFERKTNQHLDLNDDSEWIVEMKKRIPKFVTDVFELVFIGDILQDSLRHFEWRITDEKREIAGFDCRKAVTRICDSVYVVAFYTDQIPVSSGPESFGNLPGMILGLAVPRLSITWFATRVELITPTAQLLQPALKGKKTNWVKYNADLQKAMKDWGKEGASNMWKFSL